jgi:signal transduction histidine kinase
VVEIQDAIVACAPEVLGQILRNVLGNALKYRAADRPCRLEITTRVESRWVTLAAADNGRGMEPGAVERAFEPFFRGTSEGTGHGLGLAIVDSYLRALGGSVQLRSELGAGTWVRLRLPRMTPGAEGALEARGMPRRQDVPLDTGA